MQSAVAFKAAVSNAFSQRSPVEWSSQIKMPLHKASSLKSLRLHVESLPYKLFLAERERGVFGAVKVSSLLKTAVKPLAKQNHLTQVLTKNRSTEGSY